VLVLAPHIGGKPPLLKSCRVILVLVFLRVQ